jgi:hypothetical protein
MHRLWKDLEENPVIHRLLSLVTQTRLLLRWVVALALLIASLTFDVPIQADRAAGLTRLLGPYQFNLAGWITDAALVKIGQELAPAAHALSGPARAQAVRDYVDLYQRYRELSAQVNLVFVDPDVGDPTTATVALRAERDALRQVLDQRQTLVEAVLQTQVEEALTEAGIAFAGQVVPPVRFRLTPLPDLLIVSRRDKIQRIDSRELRAGLNVDDIDRLEREIDRRFDVSSMITPIGGYGTYPTMLPETTSLSFLIETITHEWVHNYLLLSPVGLNYATDGVAQTINETAAILVQREIGARIVARHYPELIKPSASLVTDVTAQTEPAFDFRAEMRATRLRADALLAEGRIEEAEAYMEERRALFVKNRYNIRKLNQAYFAFYGAYNAEPGGAGAAGRDPVGPAVQALWQRAPNVRVFLEAIATVHTLEDVERALR